MKPTTILLLFISILTFSCSDPSTEKKEPYKWPEGVAAPIAEKQNKELLAHGDTRIDEYYWMNDFFKKGPDSTKVVDYLIAENAYLDTMMSGTNKFQEELFTEMKGRIKEKD
jgi:oligopeptidase B